jgi:FkbM family methyltransferase
MKNIFANLIKKWRQLDRLEQLCTEVEALKKECKLAIPVYPDVVLTRVEEFIVSLPARDHGMVASYTFCDNIEQGFRRLFRQMVQEGMTVVDVGAHIGIYSLLASSRVGPNGHVFSFEPTPAIYELLRANIGRTTYRRLVSLYPNAVTERHGERVAFAVSADSTRDSSLFFDAKADRQTIIEVETVALDRVIPKDRRVDVVKIDAEGAEPAVIRGMQRILEDNPDVLIFMEFAPEHIRRSGESAEALIYQLSGLGFRFYSIRDFEAAFDALQPDEMLGKDSANLLISRRTLKSPDYNC